jgi:hypothetical protein
VKALALGIVCTLALVAPAHAQFGGFGGFGGFGQQQQQLGTVLAVPMTDLGTVFSQNIIHQNNVQFLALGQKAAGLFNTQVAIVSVKQFNGAPAKHLWLPKKSIPWIEQTNSNTTIVEQEAYGVGNSQVAQVEVAQANYASVKAGSRYFLCPAWAAGQIQQSNTNVTYINQFAAGEGNTQLALVGVAQENAKTMKVPAGALPVMVQVNTNVTVINQVAVGNGNTQVAQVSVGQNNR